MTIDKNRLIKVIESVQSKYIAQIKSGEPECKHIPDPAQRCISCQFQQAVVAGNEPNGVDVFITNTSRRVVADLLHADVQAEVDIAGVIEGALLVAIAAGFDIGINYAEAETLEASMVGR